MFARPAFDRPSAIGYGTYDDTIRTLEGALSPGPFLLGDRFTAADVFVGSQIGFLMMMKAIEPRPVFTAYHARLAERPAYKRFDARAQELMGQLQPAKPEPPAE